MNRADLWLRLRALLFRKSVDRELREELDFHIEMSTRKNSATSGNAGDARRRALIRFGGMDRVAEECRDERRINLIENIFLDLRYAWRQLRKSPGFAVVAILTLALGIGANAAIFQLVDALRLRSLPVKDPKQLVEVRLLDYEHTRGSFRGRLSSLTSVLWEEIRDRQQAFSGMFAWGDDRFNLRSGGEKQYAEGLWVSGDFFRVLGVQPALGRLLNAADDVRGCSDPVAVISHSFWLRQYGGSSTVVGESISLDGRRFQIAGVAARGFSGVEPGQGFDVAIPICSEALISGPGSSLLRRDAFWLSVIGRLKPGWSMEQAVENLRVISPAVFKATLPPVYPAQYVEWYLNFKLTARPAAAGTSTLRHDYEIPLWVLMGTTGLVLLIACANLANLLLARGSARSREVAVRLALGASRRRVMFQFLTESLQLAAVGALVGFLLSQLLSGFLVNFLSTNEGPLFLDLTPDWRMIAFISGLATLTCVLFGLLPAIRAARNSPASAMKSSGRGLTAGRERQGMRRLLVVCQVALSVLLLVSALLFTRTLRNLTILDAGFQPEGVYLTRVDLRGVPHDVQNRPALYKRMLEQLRTADGIESAAQVRVVPVSGDFWDDEVWVGDKVGEAMLNAVSDGYFRTMKTQFVAGRDFTDRDNSSSTKVAIVNEAFAREFLNGANPIGIQLHRQPVPGQPPPPTYEVVGLVRDAKYSSLRRNIQPTVFFAALQEEPSTSRWFMLRSSAATPQLTNSVKAALLNVSPNIAFEFRDLSMVIRQSLQQEQLLATTTGFFGFLATTIAILGLYGVLAYMVSQRRNEIGLRMALGASRGRVTEMVLREATTLLIVGLSIGAVLSVLATRLVAKLLFGVRPSDPLTILLAIAVLGVVAAIASYVPARRAAAIDPMQTLRED